LLAIECALAVLLLAGSGLMIRSLQRLHVVDQGFRSEGVLLARVSLAPIAQRASGPAVRGGELIRRRDFYQQVFERLNALPGVTGVGFITDLLVRGYVDGSIRIGNRPPEPAGVVGSASVSPGFFETLQVPLRQGRFFSDTDVLTQLHHTGLDRVEWTRGE